MEALAALRLQVEWGVDEALAGEPAGRLTPVAPLLRDAPRPVPSQPAAAPSPVLAGTLGALHAAIEAFEGCPLRETATHTVRPDGNPAAGLVLVGEAPGAEDDRSGRAFSGGPGLVLDRVLRSIGLDRSAVLLATVVPWRPPGGRAPSEAEVQACLPFLHRLLALARPRHLMLLGAGPVRALTGRRETLRRVRGKWQEVAIPGLDAPVQALPMHPLDAWLRTPAAKRELWADLLTVRRALG